MINVQSAEEEEISKELRMWVVGNLKNDILQWLEE
jgi:hypothetical protein